ncbi:hypothetical protein T11_7073 [Trichinella zimbabwensis]|uniref:Uncharacterized protein n=1 Tax=Trichinella zimbabwensis TaxID=268475 RepID=A0A0V1GQ01_9BILA|nr:hypothetical protein T11_7073 [Trichinella zimbabwensis]
MRFKELLLIFPYTLQQTYSVKYFVRLINYPLFWPTKEARN